MERHPKKMQVLIVDDDKEICLLVREYLSRHQYDVELAHDAAQMRRKIDQRDYGLILLDVMMPGESGIDACRKLRETRNIPIIMLTAVNELVDKVVCLEAGADDYVAKPFEPRELLARIRAVQRRAADASSLQSLKGGATTWMSGGARVDFESRQVISPNGIPVPLTYNEFEVLSVLIRNLNRPVARGRLLDLALGNSRDVSDRAIDVIMSRIRKKMRHFSCELAPVPVHGLGYMLRGPDRPV